MLATDWSTISSLATGVGTLGRQRTITRFGIMPVGDEVWLASMLRNWSLGWDGPRPERDMLATAAVIERERDAADRRVAELSSVPGEKTVL